MLDFASALGSAFDSLFHSAFSSLPDWSGQVLAVIGGVFGGAIGFLVIVGTGALLALPYLALVNGPRERRKDQEVIPKHFRF